MIQLNGFGNVTFVDDSLCVKSFGIRSAAGKFSEGKLEGEATVTYVDGSFMKANFRRGVLHGLARLDLFNRGSKLDGEANVFEFLSIRKFRCKFGLCDFFDRDSWSQPRHLWEISWYESGIRVGTAWEFQIGGGCVVGKVDHKGDLTGTEVAYIYPDKFTMIVGEFEKGGLVEGKESR